MKISIIKKWYSPTEFYFQIKREGGESFYPTVDIYRKVPNTNHSATYTLQLGTEPDSEFEKRALKEFNTLIENEKKMTSLKPQIIKQVEI